MMVWHEVFSILHFPLVPAFKFHRPLWVWIKILIIWAAVSSKGFKGATMLLVVSFISFFLFYHRTGQCIVPLLNWKDSFILSTNILPAFSVFKLWYFIITAPTRDSFRSDFMKKGLLRLGEKANKSAFILIDDGTVFELQSNIYFTKNSQTKSVWHFPYLSAVTGQCRQLSESKGEK